MLEHSTQIPMCVFGTARRFLPSATFVGKGRACRSGARLGTTLKGRLLALPEILSYGGKGL